ncbi:MAG TPA: hypothetical protein VH684_26895 [Xanthobacteraceae bacterium]|jgi:hypothetical protein
MDSRLSRAQANPHHDGDVALPAPKDWADAEDALSKLAQVASDRSRPTVGSDFSADPRVTEPSLDATIRLADVNDDPLATNPTSRSIARSLIIFCVGVAATLAWQSFGGTAKQMIADSAPQLSWLSPPAADPPSSREINLDQPSPPAVEASAPQAESEKPGPVASMASETPASTALADASLALRQLEAMAHEVAAMRENLDRLAAGQEQIVREIAKLQTDRQDTRRRISALPPTAATISRKPVPPPQPAPQLSVGPLPPEPPQPAPQSSAAALPPASPELSLRPPMPVPLD